MSRIKDYIIDLLNEGLIIMPNRPKQFCTYPGCQALTDKSRCERHNFSESRRYYDKHNRPEYRKLYNTSLWKRLRIMVLKEQPLCKACKKQGRFIPATDVDHIKDHKGDASLFFDYDNLQALCHECHSRKTAQTK
jgi:5-methylcytosine-specific restriction protein A